MKPSVLIVGAGPVGLSLACELGLRGIACVLVEKRDGSITVPKMSVVSSRNMEFCRRWGIASTVRSAVWPESHALDIVYMESLKGRELARVKVPSYRERGRLEFTPEGACHCPQIYFDPILAARAQSFPAVEIRYGVTLSAFTQDETGVTAELTDGSSGVRSQIRANYLIGCDGPSGVVREGLGVALDGLGVVARSLNIFFRAPELNALHDKGWARIYRSVDETGCWSELIPINGEDLWRLAIFNDEASTSDPHRYLVQLAGAPFSHEIISVTPWERRDYVAQCFGFGRVFIAGDAAHQCSPTAGMGMHMGMEDAINLAWKIEAVLAGWGGPLLLPSYEIERRQIDVRNVALSTQSFHDIVGLPGWNKAAADATPADEQDSLTRWRAHLDRLSSGEYQKIQYCYEASPVCVDDETPPIDYDARRFTPSTRPGTRAPHAWLTDNKSTLDLFGDGFVLLRLGPRPPDVASLLRAAQNRGVPLSVHDVDHPIIADLYQRELVLVRPDGHVAWRDRSSPEAAEELIDRIRGAASPRKRQTCAEGAMAGSPKR